MSRGQKGCNALQHKAYLGLLGGIESSNVGETGQVCY